MVIDAKVSLTEATRNFQKVAEAVAESGTAIITENDKPRYAVIDFAEYENILAAIEMRKAQIEALSDSILSENAEAFTELAK